MYYIVLMWIGWNFESSVCVHVNLKNGTEVLIILLTYGVCGKDYRHDLPKKAKNSDRDE